MNSISTHRMCRIVAEMLFWALFLIAASVFPDRLVLLSQILIAGLFALSLDIALGYAGILTLGHAAFYGLGAYTAGLLAHFGHTSALAGLFAGGVAALLAGYLSSFLITRGHDLSRLMITIGICGLCAELANQLGWLTGGADGLQGVTIAPLLGRFDFDLYGRTAFVYCFVVVLVAFLAVRRLIHSPFGLTLRGIDQNRKRMVSLGSPVARRMRLAYALSALIAGLAGALLAQTTQFVGLDSLSIDTSAQVLIMLVVGGAGSLYGGFVGAAIYMVAHDRFADLDPQYWMFWLGLLLIAVVLLARGGVSGLMRGLMSGLVRRRAGAQKGGRGCP
jgi:branched-chain amino acid transport system permease protein